MNDSNIKYIGLSIKNGYFNFVTILKPQNKSYKICDPQDYKFSKSKKYVIINGDKYLVIK